MYLAGWMLFFCLASPSFIFLVVANDQGFVWGIEEGDRLDYRLTYTETNGSVVIASLDEEMYIVIETLPAIPDDIDGAEAPLLHAIASMYWQNGSDFDYVRVYDFFYVLPIGNWPLLTQLYTELWQGSRDIYQDSIIWGMQGTEDLGNITLTFTEQILKEDGVSTYTYIQLYIAPLDITMITQFVRAGYSRRAPPLIRLTLSEELILGILGLSVVIISLSVFQFRRSRQVAQAESHGTQSSSSS